ncbi:GntR family transcriptional regulator [soil metagenome]
MANDEVDNEITERLRATILSGSLPPGTRLPEETLATTFGVSRTRIRPVLQWLAFERLVVIEKNRGAFIASPTPKEARDVFEARRVIERVTTDIVARTVVTPSIRALRRHIDAQETAVLQGDRQRAIRESGELHLQLARLAHNTALVAALESLILRTSLIVALYGGVRSLRGAVELQKRVIDMLEEGNAGEASTAMERCLYAIEEQMELVIAVSPNVDIQRAIAGAVAFKSSTRSMAAAARKRAAAK